VHSFNRIHLTLNSCCSICEREPLFSEFSLIFIATNVSKIELVDCHLGHSLQRGFWSGAHQNPHHTAIQRPNYIALPTPNSEADNEAYCSAHRFADCEAFHRCAHREAHRNTYVRPFHGHSFCKADGLSFADPNCDPYGFTQCDSHCGSHRESHRGPHHLAHGLSHR